MCRNRQRLCTSGARGGEKTGPNPTDRGKKDSKHHVIVDAQGLPLGVSLTAANANDITQLLPLVDAIAAIAGHHAVEQKPSKAIGPTIRSSTGERCDADPSLLAKRGTAHSSHLGAFRWVVERTLSWLHLFRRLRVRLKTKQRTRQ